MYSTHQILVMRINRKLVTFEISIYGFSAKIRTTLLSRLNVLDSLDSTAPNYIAILEEGAHMCSTSML